MNKINFKKDVLPYLIILLVIIIIKELVIYPVRVKGTSMNPNLVDGDIMILNEIGLKFRPIKRGDIVVANVNGTYIIKRVIGLPSDKLLYSNNKLYINGYEYNEKYLNDNAIKDTCNYSYDICEHVVEVPKNKYYLMGDNRGVSEDSRMLGYFDKGSIKGVAKHIIFPISRFGNVE